MIDDATTDAVTGGDLTLHEAMQRQVLAILEDSELTEEQKQQILIAMSCPCCGGNGISITISLKGGDRPGF